MTLVWYVKYFLLPNCLLSYIALLQWCSCCYGNTWPLLLATKAKDRRKTSILTSFSYELLGGSLSNLVSSILIKSFPKFVLVRRLGPFLARQIVVTIMHLVMQTPNLVYILIIAFCSDKPVSHSKIQIGCLFFQNGWHFLKMTDIFIS